MCYYWARGWCGTGINPWGVDEEVENLMRSAMKSQRGLRLVEECAKRPGVISLGRRGMITKSWMKGRKNEPLHLTNSGHHTAVGVKGQKRQRRDPHASACDSTEGINETGG